MDKDQVLARELGKLGAIGGGIGGSMGGVLSAAAGAMGGASGAWVAARFLPTESYTSNCVVPYDVRTALQMILNALAGIGRLQDSPEINSPYPTIVAVMGSGFMKLNPCLITVEIAPYSDSKSKAVIRGAAKEGLIKQGTAEKAVVRVIDAIKGERV